MKTITSKITFDENLTIHHDEILNISIKDNQVVSITVLREEHITFNLTKEPCNELVPLTKEELINNDWFMVTATNEDKQLLRFKGFDVENPDDWPNSTYPYCRWSKGDILVSRISSLPHKPDKLIYRIGHEFYWSIPQ